MHDTNTVSDADEAIAGAVRAELARRRMSQQDLRTRTGWSRSFLARRINGEVGFSVGELVVIAKSINADPVAFFQAAVNDPGPRPSGGAGTGPGRAAA